MTAPAPPITVLIVEDDPSTRELLARALARAGIGTLQAAGVGEALLRLEEGPPPAAVILDLMLPDASGAVLLGRIRRDALPMRVAVVSGASDTPALREVMRHRPDRVFTKPIELADLIGWVQQV